MTKWRRLIVDFTKLLTEECGTESSKVQKNARKRLFRLMESVAGMRTVRRQRRRQIHSLNHKQKMTDKLRKWQLQWDQQNKSSDADRRYTGSVQEAGKQPEAVKEKIPTAAKPTETRDLGNSWNMKDVAEILPCLNTSSPVKRNRTFISLAQTHLNKYSLHLQMDNEQNPMCQDIHKFSSKVKPRSSEFGNSFIHSSEWSPQRN